MLKIIISAALLWFVFSQIDFADVISVIGKANIFWILSALLFFVISKIIAAYRLNTFFKCAGLNISATYNLKLYLLGMFYNLFLPGGIGGDAYKVFLLNKTHVVKTKDLVWSTLLDRVTGMLALIVLIFALIPFLPVDTYIKITSVALIPISIFIAYIVIKMFFKKYEKAFTLTNIQSMGVQLSQLLTAYFILLSFNYYENTILFIVIFLISSLVAVFPFTLGGAGAREFTFVLVGNWLVFDMPEKQTAIALGLTFYLITLTVSFFGIIYHFNLKKIKSG